MQFLSTFINILFVSFYFLYIDQHGCKNIRGFLPTASRAACSERRCGAKRAISSRLEFPIDRRRRLHHLRDTSLSNSRDIGWPWPDGGTDVWCRAVPPTIFTIGLLLLARGTWVVWLSIIPFLWSLVGLAAALQLGIPEDLELPVGGCRSGDHRWR